ncbi:hypothetical protein PC119_g19688 [Phytophthora cactorum]|uniref:Uncharacterized protein n=1 Tax=Phytophthora cactorum TaxID=29920 RepID=A0A8T1BQM9_9STRA|nr:hypothetical protein PC117_g19937 [Phytophthora cactorum]KAG2987390.1 hypothetical protein PC119_g19688 [Phytophthora cactorum]
MMSTAACVRSYSEANARAPGQVRNAPEAKCSNDGISASNAVTIVNEAAVNDPKLPGNAVKVVDLVPSIPSEHNTTTESTEVAVATVEETYVSAARVLMTEGNETSGGVDRGNYDHPANKMSFDGYLKELAFLPDLTEKSNTTIDLYSPNVKPPWL